MSAVFSRLANLWTGFINLWISDVEKEHPEIAYENAINGMVEKYTALKRRRPPSFVGAKKSPSSWPRRRKIWPTSRAISTRRWRPTRMTSPSCCCRRRTRWKRRSTSCARPERRGQGCRQRQVVADVGAVRDQEAQGRKETMLAKMHSAQARMRIQEQLEGLSVDTEVRRSTTCARTSRPRSRRPT